MKQRIGSVVYEVDTIAFAVEFEEAYEREKKMSQDGTSINSDGTNGDNLV